MAWSVTSTTDAASKAEVRRATREFWFDLEGVAGANTAYAPPRAAESTGLKSPRASCRNMTSVPA